MKRGPAPARGFEVAIPVAHMRGSVMLFRQSPWYVGDFTITGNGFFAVVRLRMAQRIRATIGEITRIFSEDITSLSTIPGGGPLVRELWLYSRYGYLRFFRLEEAGLIEIDCYGFSFVNGKPVIHITMPAIPGNANSVPSRRAAEILPGSILPHSGLPEISGVADSAAGNSRNPIFRWLAKKNAGTLKVPDGTDPSGPTDSEKNTGASISPADSVETINGVLPAVPGSETLPGDTDPMPEPGTYNGVR